MKRLLVLILLFITTNAYAVPTNSMSITPSAVDGTTIEASDENTRNSEISTKFNAHDHTDVGQTGNTLKVGDGAAGNKTIQANNADGSKPYIQYDDTNDKWIVSIDGTNTGSIVMLTGSDSHYHLPQSMSNNDLMVSNGTTLQILTGPTVSGAALTATGGGILAYQGMANHGEMEFFKNGARTAISFGTQNQVLTIDGNDPVWSAPSVESVMVGTFTKSTGDASGTTAYTGVGFKPASAIFIVGVNASTNTSIGAGDINTNSSIYLDTNGNDWRLDTDDAIHALISSGNEYEGDIQSFDSDGFTINWTRTGTPGATITVTYIAIEGDA